jgi:gluconolactonase
MEFREIAGGLGFPEGPVVMPDGAVLLVEIARKTLTRVGADGKIDVIADLGGGPNGAAVGPDGAIYVCNNGGRFTFALKEGRYEIPLKAPDYPGGSIQRVDLATGRAETLYDRFEGRRLIAPNDLVFDSHGGFWFTDHSLFDDLTLTFGAVYYGRADGSSLRRAAHRLLSPNGIGLSPDETRLYVADTFSGRLWSLDLAGPGQRADDAPCLVTGGKTIGALAPGQCLDSMAVEADGRICVATQLASESITVFGADGGGFEQIAVPGYMTTNLCFGGADMRDAYITCGGDGRLLACRWPRPGLSLAYNL